MKVIRPDEIAERFLVQYHKLLEGGVEALEGEKTFTSEQTLALYNGIKHDPTSMVMFLNQVAYLIKLAMNDKYGEDSSETQRAVEQYMVLMFAVLIPAVHTLMKENNILSEMVEHAALSELDNFTQSGGSVDANSEDLFKNLDFQLPDFDNLNGKDIN